MIFLAFTTIGVFILILLAGFGSLLLRGSRRLPHGAALGLLLVSLLAPRGSALDIRKADTVTVPAGQTVNDTLIATGDTISIDGAITGNLIAAARHIIVRGSVQGDVFAGGQTVELEGTVGGNVVASGQWLNVRGKVAGSVHFWGQQFRLESSGEVQGDLLLFTGESRLDGKVARDVMTFTGVTEARGSIGRHLTAYTGQLRLSAPARVGGNLTAHVDNKRNVFIDSGATVAGKTEIEIGQRGRSTSRFSQPRFYFWQGMQFLAALLAGGLVLLFFPDFFQSTTQAVGAWGRSMGLGFAVLIAVPVAVVLAFISLIGIPVALTTLALYVGGLYLAKVFVGVFLGQAIFRRPLVTRGDTLLALASGLLVLFVMVQIPFAVGTVMHSAVFCLGLGAFSFRLYHSVGWTHAR